MGVSGWGWVAGKIDYKANSASNLLETTFSLGVGDVVGGWVGGWRKWE